MIHTLFYTQEEQMDTDREDYLRDRFSNTPQTSIYRCHFIEKVIIYKTSRKTNE